ncbi:MAG: GNAT family N-acetyltransferase [Chitinophagaceae bacterium]
MSINWKLSAFCDLSPAELYEFIRIRIEVFVVEQGCAFQDLDNLDHSAHHIMGRNEKGKLVAYSRILPPGLIYSEASIGRVVISPSSRRLGFGKLLMQNSLENLYSLYGKVPIKIGAQVYLLKFYESFGFKSCGEEYLEDNIAHVLMVLGAS